MLPLHTPQPRRRALAAALVLAATGLAYAAQPAEAPSPVQQGYSKLRLDVQLSVNGKALAPQVLLETFNATMVQRFDLGDGQRILLLADGRPHRDPAIAQGEEVLMLGLRFIDSATGDVLAQPRIATQDGVPARIEFGTEGERVLRLDVLPRVVRTRLHDGQGARAELLRDIAEGRAAKVSVTP